MAQLLLIDDEPALILNQVRHIFSPRGVEIVVAQCGDEGLERFARQTPDAVLLDVSLPDIPGLEVYQRLRRLDARIPVIFITARTTTETAIEAMRFGAYDYLFKPIDLQQLDKVVTEAIELSQRIREPTRVGGHFNGREAGDGGDAIIGHCPAMREVYKAIGRVADKNVIVLITGESGTGKELVARALYKYSLRSQSPFLAINCAAIPENLLESELFGHEKGAFTGADRRRIGKFEQCNGGTVFLDEIGDMPLATQSKVLRLLQDQRFERIGGHQTIQTDVRVIAATNCELKAACESGKFRPDLYYRLSVFTIHLPALRERGDDLPMLVQFFLRRYGRELGREVFDVSPKAMERLKHYHWPGNVRELQNVLKQSLLRSQGNVLLPEFLPPLGDSDQPQTETAGTFDLDGFIRQRLQTGTTNLYSETAREVDRILIGRTLEFTKGNQLHAARILGIARQTFRSRLRDLGLNITTSVDVSGDAFLK